MVDTVESRAFWERAGEMGYENAVFASPVVARHVMERVYAKTMALADAMGTPSDGRVLELGCGDGGFAAKQLARHYGKVEAFDVSEAAIARAQAQGAANADFRVADITTMDLEALGTYDSCFLMAVLHHIKSFTPAVVNCLGKVAKRVVILEPNGNNFGRKLAELTPRYRAAGEESFRVDELTEIFAAAGFRPYRVERFNFFPDMTPEWLFRMLRPVEPLIEASPLDRWLCTCILLGFERV